MFSAAIFIANVQFFTSVMIIVRVIVIFGFQKLSGIFLKTFRISSPSLFSRLIVIQELMQLAVHGSTLMWTCPDF